MPKVPTFQPSIDECLTISTSTLRKWGQLKKSHNIYNASFNWKRNGKRIATIDYSIEVIDENHKRMVLAYNHRDTPIKYAIEIVGISTNLGNGLRWYFICPYTGKRCMNLICPSGSQFFLHRTAFPELMYDSQKRSKEYRRINTTFGWLFEEERLNKQLNQKHRKTHYRGKPTPLVLSINKLWEKVQMKYSSNENLRMESTSQKTNWPENLTNKS